MPVKKGDVIKVEYEGTLDDGTVFDSSQTHDEDLEFEVGAGQVIPGFEEAVVGMKEGEEKEIDLSPSEAYGEVNDFLVQKVPRDQFPEGIEAGMTLVICLPDGTRMPFKILEVGDEEVTVDLNHPLAGKTLHFKLKIVSIAS